ncbi:hypothetical protein VC83_00719 [Pseudogymnoascus destructans]|uniref:Uncharacterized protein n=1 Tax=Pseudogymnoascus destructans TaxID=655981 RepID=A0A177AKR1_9PEZI|nr:uncharacterized protein VC83_00719 [Pseudogymnoascus destructans]OAF62390.1 hypothetical protein VC83_00719 [Pseudogymnoascus destructans]
MASLSDMSAFEQWLDKAAIRGPNRVIPISVAIAVAKDAMMMMCLTLSVTTALISPAHTPTPLFPIPISARRSPPQPGQPGHARRTPPPPHSAQRTAHSTSPLTAQRITAQRTAHSAFPHPATRPPPRPNALGGDTNQDGHRYRM